MKKYTEGEIIEGKVTGIEDYGIFISFDDKNSGLIHISEISNNYIRNIHEYAKIGETMRATILGIDENNHYKLSVKNIKKMEDDNNREKEIDENGFKSLSRNLSLWIQESMEKMNKK